MHPSPAAAVHDAVCGDGSKLLSAALPAVTPAIEARIAAPRPPTLSCAVIVLPCAVLALPHGMLSSWFAGGLALLAQTFVADESTVAVALAVSPPDEVSWMELLQPLRLTVELV